VSLNEAVFVAGTLVMQSCTGTENRTETEITVFSSKPNRP